MQYLLCTEYGVRSTYPGKNEISRSSHASLAPYGPVLLRIFNARRETWPCSLDGLAHCSTLSTTSTSTLTSTSTFLPPKSFARSLFPCIFPSLHHSLRAPSVFLFSPPAPQLPGYLRVFVPGSVFVRSSFPLHPPSQHSSSSSLDIPTSFLSLLRTMDSKQDVHVHGEEDGYEMEHATVPKKWQGTDADKHDMSVLGRVQELRVSPPTFRPRSSRYPPPKSRRRFLTLARSGTFNSSHFSASAVL